LGLWTLEERRNRADLLDVFIQDLYQRLHSATSLFCKLLRALEDIQPSSWKQMPIRFETTFLLWTCYRPLEQLGTVCDRLCYC